MSNGRSVKFLQNDSSNSPSSMITLAAASANAASVSGLMRTHSVDFSAVAE